MATHEDAVGRSRAASQSSHIAPHLLMMPGVVSKEILQFFADEAQAEQLMPLQLVSKGTTSWTRLVGFDVIGAAARACYLPLAHCFRTAPVTAPRRNHAPRNRGLRDGEFKIFGEMTLGGQRLRYGNYSERDKTGYGLSLAPVSGLMPQHKDDPYVDGHLLFFGPLVPVAAPVEFSVTLKASPSRSENRIKSDPPTWGEFLFREEDDGFQSVAVRWDRQHRIAALHGACADSSRFTFRALRYDPSEEIDDETLAQARNLRDSWRGAHSLTVASCYPKNTDEIIRLMLDSSVQITGTKLSAAWSSHRSSPDPSEWRSKTLVSCPVSHYDPIEGVSAGTGAEMVYEGGFGAGLRRQCPLICNFHEAPYSRYIPGDDADSDDEGTMLNHSGIYYDLLVEPPPGPFSDIFMFCVHIYFKPCFPRNSHQAWTEDIDLDDPLPPFRPYAISITLIKRSALESICEEVVTEETALAYLDMLM